MLEVGAVMRAPVGTVPAAPPWPDPPTELPPLPLSPCRVAAADSDLTQEELEAQLEAFMRRQAEIESGAAARKAEPGKVLGADEVSEEVRLCVAGCIGSAAMHRVDGVSSDRACGTALWGCSPLVPRRPALATSQLACN